MKTRKRGAIMQIFDSFQDIASAENNTVYVNPERSSIRNSKITFKGKNNVLFVEDGVALESSAIVFGGDNCVVYLSNSSKEYRIAVDVYQNSAVFFGSNNYFNGIVHIIASEGQNILIGNGGLFSFGIWIRTADPHLIYSAETHKRINNSKSVFIGDHVWIGQNALVLKGCRIGSGSILGGGAVASNKLIPSNTSFAGNPAALVSRGIFFDGKCVHNWTQADTEKHAVMESDQWIYHSGKNTLCFEKIDAELKQKSSTEEKLEFIKTQISQNTDKNRFFVADISVKSQAKRKKTKSCVKSVLRKIKSL